MKSLFKRATTLAIVLALFVSTLTISVFAASSSVAFSKDQLNVGETLTVTARFSSSEKMYGVEGYIYYDPAVVEFVSGDNCNLLTKGKAKIVLQSAGKTNLSETIKFKTLKVGKSAITLKDLVYVNDGESEKPMDGCSAAVTVVDKSTQASSNANLKSLKVSSGTLTPKFDPNVTSYSVTIKSNETSLLISANAADSKASVNVEGSKEMKVGTNKRVVVVTAENGKTKKYTVNITRLAPDGQQPPTDTPEDNEPLNDLIEVSVGDKTMYVVEDFTGVETPKGFSVIEYALNGKTVPALSDDNYILLMLRMPDNSDKGFYVYDKDGTFTELITVTVGGQVYTILPTDEVPDGYSVVYDFTIGEVVVPALKSDNAALGDFALVYAKGPSGETSFYRYDTVDNTIQRFVDLSAIEGEDDDTVIDEPNTDVIATFMELNTNGKIVVVTILAIIILLIIAIIVLIIKIATAGKDNYDEDDDEESFYEEDNNGIVGFEQVSVTNNIDTQPEEEEVLAEETTEEVVDETEEEE
ncbi:MAG: cadherin-like beta sandwich domain-containing protein [Clostridia bacterium]|nr:cadherin-like beta sandwich domain-containing protein [Clostridia bacterium]